MLEGGLDQIFPELLKILLNPIPSSQFFSFPYFSRYVGLVSEKQCRSKAQKSHKHFQLIKVKKGTVIYNCDDMAERGFIIFNGSVQLLKKKSQRQKTQTFANHILYNDQQKYQYLFDNFHIPRNKAQQLLNMFYEQKMMFKFLPFHVLFNNQDFGFGEMVRNTSRTHTAIALQETQLLVINKNNFEQCLRDFHQKKEASIVSKLLAGCRQQLAEEMMPKMMSVMNTTLLLNYDKEDVIYDQTQFPTNIFFVISGEIQVRKKVILTVPKKFMKHEIKDPIEKEVIIKVCRYEKGSFFGEEQIFSGRKNQNNVVACILNNSLILKIDHSIFLKSIGDFLAYEKMLIENAVYKKSHSDASYEKQYKKAYTSFISQYEAYDNKKKQKMLSNFMNDNQNKNILFEAFAPQGVFFRDTFQKLQGFEQAQNSPIKSHSIKRFKKKSNHMDTTNNGGKHQNETPKIPKKDENEIAEKMLFSPKRSMNMAQFYVQSLQTEDKNESKLSSPAIKQASTQKNPEKSLNRRYKSIGKFQHIQKDEEIFKRVMIKNGLYPIDKTIDKSNAAKPLVHHNFDEVVKQCITRKNQTLKRTSKQKQNQIIVQSFHRSVQSLKNKSISTHSLKLSRFSTPCKGADQLRRRMHNMQSLGSGRFSDLARGSKKSIITKIQDCIGVNEKPKSSEISMRNASSVHRLSAYPSSNRSPQRVVFLNHMMKPITYFNSTEL